MKTAENYRKTIQEVFNTVSEANNILQLMLPDEKKKPMNEEVAEIVKRMDILRKIDERLVFIDATQAFFSHSVVSWNRKVYK